MQEMYSIQKWGTFAIAERFITYIEHNNKHPKFKVGDHAKNQNIKIFLQKVALQIGLKSVL